MLVPVDSFLFPFPPFLSQAFVPLLPLSLIKPLAFPHRQETFLIIARICAPQIAVLRTPPNKGLSFFFSFTSSSQLTMSIKTYQNGYSCKKKQNKVVLLLLSVSQSYANKAIKIQMLL